MLHNAQHNANDEFYTRLDTIEQEFAHYDPKAFAGRTIYCPCDNPTCSMFVRFLLDHHAALRWSRLIASCWANPQPSLFSIESHPFLPMLLDVTRPPAPGMPVAWAACMPGNTLSRLDGDGDWRSAECSRLREQADLIVTNPPFGGARQLIGTLLNERKDMLLLSSLTVVNEPAIFQAIQEGRLRLGATMHAGAAKYSIPDTTPINAASGGTDGQGRYIRVTGVRWFATLPHDHTPAFRPHAHYDPGCHPMFDGTRIINCDRVKDMPADWDGLMGVPLTFLDKWDPAMFDLEGMLGSRRDMGGPAMIDGRERFTRLIVRRRTSCR